MAIDKKKREKRRNKKTQDKLLKGREVYFPPVWFRLIEVVPMQKKTDN